MRKSTVKPGVLVAIVLCKLIRLARYPLFNLFYSNLADLFNLLCTCYQEGRGQ